MNHGFQNSNFATGPGNASMYNSKILHKRIFMVSQNDLAWLGLKGNKLIGAERGAHLPNEPAFARPSEHAVDLQTCVRKPRNGTVWFGRCASNKECSSNPYIDQEFWIDQSRTWTKSSDQIDHKNVNSRSASDAVAYVANKHFLSKWQRHAWSARASSLKPSLDHATRPQSIPHVHE